MHTIKSLDFKTFDALEDLASANVDSSMSLEEAAHSVEDNELGNLFMSMARRRRGNVQVLRGYVQFDAAQHEVRGSLKGTLHRWWLHLRASMQHENALAVVAQAERSEAAIQQTYESILVRVAGNALYDVLHTQYREVIQNHARVRDMRARLEARKH